MKHTITNRAAIVAVIVAALFLSTGFVQAQVTQSKITTTAVPFLSISPDARSGGMGDLGLATSPDAYSGSHNAAKTPFGAAPSGIGVTYTPWLRDIVQGMYLLSAAGYHQLDDNQALSASLRYFNLGDVQVSDYSGNRLSTSHPREYSIDFGYSRKLSNQWGVGLTARYIRSDLGAGAVDGTTYKAANAVAADVSLYYDGRAGSGGNAYAGSGWSGGLVCSNLGSPLSYSNDATDRDFLPANIGLGVAYTGVVDEDNKWMLSAEGNKLLVPAVPSDSAGMAAYHSMDVVKSWGKSFGNSAYKFSAGGEYAFKGVFFLRVGYNWETAQEGGLRYFTAGAGFCYSMAAIDFSYLAPSGNGTARNPLSSTFRLGILFSLRKTHATTGK